jgi:hypothetical protein
MAGEQAAKMPIAIIFNHPAGPPHISNDNMGVTSTTCLWTRNHKGVQRKQNVWSYEQNRPECLVRDFFRRCSQLAEILPQELRTIGADFDEFLRQGKGTSLP